ncbi:MAG: IPT/TIG domain-containing protein [Gallionellaceae bacterium]|jgi:hypothetical protein
MQIKPFIRKASEIGVGLTAIATLVLAGCGGGGGGSSGGSSSTAMTTLSVSPSLGRFAQGAHVRIKDRNGAQIGSGFVNASGVAAIDVPTSSQAPLLVEAGLTDDQYYDEIQGWQTISGISGVGVRALVPDHTVASQVGVTALTEIAVGSLVDASGVVPAGVTAASAVGANATVAQSFGVTDLLAPPKLVGSKADLNGLGTTDADKYALKLAALANMAGTGEGALQVAHRLRNDLNLTNPASGIAATINAMNTALGTIPSAPINAQSTAQITNVPHANAKLKDLIPAAIAATHDRLALLDTGLTKAQIISALNTAAVDNASGVMSAIAANPSQSAASAIQAAQTLAQQWAASAVPVITSFSPSSGVVGDTVTIMGNGFDPFYLHNVVKFSGVQATVNSIVVGTTSSLTVKVPTGATTGSITVTNTMGQLVNKTGTSATNFTVNSASTSSTPAAPAAPTGVTATATSSTAISVSWTAVTGAASYDVYRAASTGGLAITAMTKVNSTSVTGTSLSDTGLTAATPYYYRVVANNAVGASAASTEGKATTSAASSAGGTDITLVAPTVAAGTKFGGAVMGPLTLSGTVTPVTLTPALDLPPLKTALTTDGSSLYVYGGTAASGSGVYKIDKTTGVVSLLATTSGTFSALTSDGTNIFASSYGAVGGVGSGGIYQIAPAGTVTLLLANSSLGYTPPTGMAVVGSNLYFTTTSKIKKLDLTTNAVTTHSFGANACLTGQVCDGVGTNTTPAASGATLGTILGAMTSDGTYLYVLEASQANPGIVRQISIADGSVKTIGGRAGLTQMSSWLLGTGITTDGAGNVYVVKQASSQIIKYDIATGASSVVATGSAAGTACATNTTPVCTGVNGGVTSDGTNLYTVNGGALVKIQ